MDLTPQIQDKNSTLVAFLIMCAICWFPFRKGSNHSHHLSGDPHCFSFLVWQAVLFLWFCFMYVYLGCWFRLTECKLFHHCGSTKLKSFSWDLLRWSEGTTRLLLCLHSTVDRRDCRPGRGTSGRKVLLSWSLCRHESGLWTGCGQLKEACAHLQKMV